MLIYIKLLYVNYCVVWHSYGRKLFYFVRVCVLCIFLHLFVRRFGALDLARDHAPYNIHYYYCII